MIYYLKSDCIQLNEEKGLIMRERSKEDARDVVIRAKNKNHKTSKRAAVARTAVAKLTVIELTAKVNPIRGDAD